MKLIKTAFLESWITFRKNWKQLIVFSLIFIAIGVAFSLLDERLRVNKTYTNYFSNLTNLVFSTFLSLGLIRISLRLINKKSVEYKHFFNNWRLFGKFMLASILKSLIIVSPIIILIIITSLLNIQKDVIWATGIIVVWLCIYLAVSLQFVEYLIVDKDTSIIDSLKRSIFLSKGVKIRLIVIFLMLIILNLVGLSLLLLGLIITIPVTWLVIANVYQSLAKNN